MLKPIVIGISLTPDLSLGLINLAPAKDFSPDHDSLRINQVSNGEVKRFDVKPYLGTGLFKELQYKSLFNSVKPFLGSIQWANGIDLFPDTLYLESK